MNSSARQPEFADAALRIVARDGLAALSFRAVASESGWSLGAVQKAFTSKEALLLATLERAQSQVIAGSSAEPAQPTLEIWLVGLVMATLPLDDDRRAAVVVGTAFADRAPFDPAIATRLSASDAAIRALLVRLFSWRRAEGELTAQLDDDALARAVLAFAGGLAAQLLYDAQPASAVEALVDGTIASLLA
ncbi:TetR/AcrR family transcriptional regulator [Leifsonia sp. A12D58]|uniref:TetR/AcrR family transcriptional regulator n=1 Tax=Leifsonia sp. A12D58 TaxID=3397674 RepID=UPI0039E1533F